MEEYIESAKNEIKKAILSYGDRETANEWKSAEEEFKKISCKVEELIYGDENRYTVKVSYQAIRFAQDIPNNWKILGNILCGGNIEKILPCILFTWLLNMNKKLWVRLQGKIERGRTTFIDKRIASLLAKSQSKTPNANNEVKITDLFFYNISKIPNDYDLAFMMVIRFLTLFKLSICSKADVNFCVSWFESKYGILRHLFTYDEKKRNMTQVSILDDIMCGLSQHKTEERSLVKYYKIFNERTQNIKTKIMFLEFSNKDDIENKTYELLMDIRQLEGYPLSFRYELFKSNYEFKRPLSNIADSLVQMCQLFDADLYIEELTVENSKGDNSQSNFILKEVTAKIESISKLQLIQKSSNNNDYNGSAIFISDDYYNDKPKAITIDDCGDTINYYKEQLNFDFLESEDYYRPPIYISKLDMLYSPHDIILKGTLKILSAQYTVYNTEFTLSCDKLEVDNAHMINTQFNFKANSEVLKSKEKEERWYNLIFLLLANEI